MVLFVQITVYVGKRDFVDHVTKVDPIGNPALNGAEIKSLEPKMRRKCVTSVPAYVTVLSVLRTYISNPLLLSQHNMYIHTYAVRRYIGVCL